MKLTVAWPTFAALSIALIATFCLWRFLPNNKEASVLAGGLGMVVMAFFTKLLAKTGATLPPPPPDAEKKP